MLSYDWVIRPSPDTTELKALSDLPPLVAQILWHRGVKDRFAAEEFLKPDYHQHLADPFLYSEMSMAVARIIAAINNKEIITVHGDYDADGVTSTAILVETLETFGAKVYWFVPDRFTEGYGLRQATVDRIKKKGTDLLITIDCGTTNIAEIQHAKDIGLDIIILDHHQPGSQRPPAVAIINPAWPGETYPFKNHSSGGVAFTLARAMLLATDHGKKVKRVIPVGWEKWLLDLVAISTVTDLMPLRGENRLLVKHGITVLKKTKRLGLKYLLVQSGTPNDQINEGTIGYQIGPRLNAAGRLRHASTAVKLLLTKDAAEAQKLVEELEKINTDRQRLTAAATAEAIDQMIIQPVENRAVVVYAPHWSPGVLGLVAGRIAEKVWKPVVVMSDLDGAVIGSVRSVAGIDIMKIMNQGADYFVRYGGHPGASGFTIPSTQRQEFTEWFIKQIGQQDISRLEKSLHIDIEVKMEEVNQSMLEQLEMLAPFGIEHPRPNIIIRHLKSRDCKLVGAEKQHLRVTGVKNDFNRPFIGFRMSSLADIVAPGKIFDAVVEPSWNEWNGRREVQFKIIDLRPSV